MLLPREIHLDDRTLEEKLIHGRRGGYCFEQNGLLESAARDRLYRAQPSGTRGAGQSAAYAAAYPSAAAGGGGGERWIADVGFGGQTLTAPIKLLADIEQSTRTANIA